MDNLMKNIQSRKWLITINGILMNNEMREMIICKLSQLSLIYYCFSFEIASTGTPHAHIFIYSSGGIRFSTIKKLFPTAHVERCIGSCKENKEYVAKTGKFEGTEKEKTKIDGSFFESGECPVDAREKAPKMQELIDMIDTGMSTTDIIRSSPNFALKVDKIEQLRNQLKNDKYKSEPRNDIEVIYIYGPTAVGKNRYVYDKHGFKDVCRITSYHSQNALFDNYTGQDVLVLDEFHGDISIGQLLTILDIYPVELSARYYTRTACFHYVYILSNLPLSRQYKAIQEHDFRTWEALLRRISHYYYKVDYDTTIEFRIEDGKIYEENI